MPDGTPPMVVIDEISGTLRPLVTTALRAIYPDGIAPVRAVLAIERMHDEVWTAACSNVALLRLMPSTADALIRAGSESQVEAAIRRDVKNLRGGRNAD